MQILGFDWHATNRRKLGLHDLGLDDIEELFESGSPHVFRRDRIRYLALGFVPDGRFALVVFEYDQETLWVRW